MHRTHVDVLQTDRENVQAENRSFACSIKTIIEEQNLVYNFYNHLNNLLSTGLFYFPFLFLFLSLCRDTLFYYIPCYVYVMLLLVYLQPM